MDVVDRMQERDIPAVLGPGPTWNTLIKILETRRSEIENHPQETFQYGSTDRHKLDSVMDVIYPDSATLSPDKPIPVLFFIYGCGFKYSRRATASSARPTTSRTPTSASSSPNGATYTAPPSDRDVRDTLSRVLSNASRITSSPTSTLPPSTPLNNLFVLAQSADANHAMSPSLLPLDSPLRAATRGALYTIDCAKPSPLPHGVLDGYYGSLEAAHRHLPLQILADAPEELVRGLPEMFVLKSAKEPGFLDASNVLFAEAIEARLGRKVREVSGDEKA